MAREAVSRIDPVGAFLEATGGTDPEPLRFALEAEGTYDLPAYDLLPQHPVNRKRLLELRAEREALHRRLAEIEPPMPGGGRRRANQCRHYLEAAGYTVIPPAGGRR